MNNKTLISILNDFSEVISEYKKLTTGKTVSINRFAFTSLDEYIEDFKCELNFLSESHRDISNSNSEINFNSLKELGFKVSDEWSVKFINNDLGVEIILFFTKGIKIISKFYLKESKELKDRTYELYIPWNTTLNELKVILNN